MRITTISCDGCGADISDTDAMERVKRFTQQWDDIVFSGLSATSGTPTVG